MDKDMDMCSSEQRPKIVLAGLDSHKDNNQQAFTSHWQFPPVAPVEQDSEDTNMSKH